MHFAVRVRVKVRVETGVSALIRVRARIRVGARPGVMRPDIGRGPPTGHLDTKIRSFGYRVRVGFSLCIL